MSQENPERVAQKKICAQNSNYIIYDDGRCYSLKRNQFLKPSIQRDKKGRIRAYLNLGRIIYMVPRLVYFNFGKHNYETIYQMPFITNIQTTTQTNADNFYIENLRLVDRTALNQKFNVDWTKKEPKFKKTFIEEIKTLYNSGTTVKKIAEHFQCSIGSIYKYLLRYNITQKRAYTPRKTTVKPLIPTTFSLEVIIPYLEATTEESWCMDVVKTTEGKSCLFGHLFDLGGSELMDWFQNIATTYMVYPVNDGKNKNYPQPTPKQRCIAYFKDLQSGKAKTTYQLIEEFERLFNPK